MPLHPAEEAGLSPEIEPRQGPMVLAPGAADQGRVDIVEVEQDGHICRDRAHDPGVEMV
jgi:hypothetical protein